MINVEQPCDDHFFGLQFPSEPDIYSDDMEFGYSQPYYNSWQENVNVMPGMKRTISNNSYPTDFAPGLTASNGSVHSGASSTVGSPYSAQFVPQDESYGLAQNSYSVPPAILNSEYGVNEMSGGDMSGMQYPHKTNGHFVGELDTPLSFKAQNTTSTFSLFGVDEAPRPNTSSPQSSRQPSPQRSHAAQAPVFKSPTAPASAYPKTPTHSTSPVRHPAHVFQNGPFQPNAFRQSPGSFMPAFGISYPSAIGYPSPQMYQNPEFNHASPMGSPGASPHLYNAQFAQTMTAQPYMQQNPYMHMARQASYASPYPVPFGHASPPSDYEEGADKRCPHPECGKTFKDIKAHMLTHQAERPEKCPITSCEYHKKGFSRKYDKNRHTLTHYKGTMVCGFCPGSGTASEKSFNRADVFKRHLCSVHGVEQAPPNSRKRTPSGSSKNTKLTSYCADATGKCSTCSGTFNNAQDFYEHLDECVMRVVQREEPTEAINKQHLSSVNDDADVQETMDRHLIKTEEQSMELQLDEDEDDEDEDEDEDDDEADDSSYSNRTAKKSKPSVLHGGIRKKGMTWSQGGVKPATTKRKHRKSEYPPSWGMSPDRVTMKKRTLVCYDGDRRLLKDEMMLNRDYEVRLPLANGEGYVTDLDRATCLRADAFHGATDEERGPWSMDHDGQEVDLGELMAFGSTEVE